jgi:hypothetical protein
MAKAAHGKYIAPNGRRIIYRRRRRSIPGASFVGLAPRQNRPILLSTLSTSPAPSASNIGIIVVTSALVAGF